MKLRQNLLCTAMAATTLASLPTTSALAVGNVKLQFNNNTAQQIGLSRLVGVPTSPAAFFPHPNERFLRVRLAEPLLCAEFPTSSTSNVRLRILDANGDVLANNNSGVANTFGGLVGITGNNGGIRYQTDGSNDHRLIVNTNGDLVCYTFQTFVVPNASSGGDKRASADRGMSYSLVAVPGNIVAKAGAGDTVFTDGFESPFVAPLDVVTTIEAPATVRADVNYVYTVRVRNTGATQVSGVMVRDFFYKATSTTISGAAVFQNGTWICAATPQSDCGTAGGTGVIYAPNVTLAANGEVSFTATRPFITNPAPPATGRTFSVAAAAFTNPLSGEQVQSNNTATANGTIVVTQPPVISGLPTGTQTLLEDGVAGPINFIISDQDTSPGLVTVTATSSNQSVVSNAGAVVGGSGGARTLTINPVANANGNVAITLTANDGTGNTDVEVINFSLTAVNDAPSFTFNPTCQVKNGTWNTSVEPAEFVFPAGTNDSESCADFTTAVFGPSDESGQGYALPLSSGIEVVSNSNPALFAQLPRFTTVQNLLQFRPTGASGVADVSIRIRDNGGTANGGADVSAPRTFRVRVQGAVPTILPIATQNVLEDFSISNLQFTVSDSDTPAGDLVVTATSSNTSLIPNASIILGVAGPDSLRTADITPLPDQFGSAIITLTVSDGAQQSQQTFTVNVASVNDAPTFNNQGDQIQNSGFGSGLRSVTNWASNIVLGPPNESDQQIDGFFVEVLQQTPSNFLSGAPQVQPSGTLRYSLSDSGGQVAFDGYACLRVTLFDNGPDAPPNVNQSQSVVVKIQVGPNTGSCPSARSLGEVVRK